MGAFRGLGALKLVTTPDGRSVLIVPAGSNKFGMEICPFCSSPGVTIDDLQHFVFRDSLSAYEHQISGLCQKCQDTTF
jgi:hypothetical protein